MGVVRFPPDDQNPAGWVRGLLTDLAGGPEDAAELLDAVRAIQCGGIAEWATSYNVYIVNLRPDGALVSFVDDSCLVPLGVMTAVIGEHLES